MADIAELLDNKDVSAKPEGFEDYNTEDTINKFLNGI